MVMNKYLENTLRERKLSSDSNASLSPLHKQGKYQKNECKTKCQVSINFLLNIYFFISGAFGQYLQDKPFLNLIILRCNPVQGQNKARTRPEQGFPCVLILTGKNLFSLQGTPVLIARILYSLQGFPCEN